MYPFPELVGRARTRIFAFRGFARHADTLFTAADERCGESAMTVSIQTRDQVEAVVRALIDACERKDAAGVMALIGDGYAGYCVMSSISSILLSSRMRIKRGKRNA